MFRACRFSCRVGMSSSTYADSYTPVHAHPRPPVLLAPYELQPGPVVTERGDFDVDDAQGQKGLTYPVLTDVADVPGGLPGPGDPEHRAIGELTDEGGRF